MQSYALCYVKKIIIFPSFEFEKEEMSGLREDLQIVRFASARAREIGVLTNLIGKP